MIVRRGASSFVACGINVCQGWLSLDTRSLVEWRWRVEGRRRGETRTEGRNDVNPEENLAGGIGNGTRWRCICRSTSDTIEFWFHPSLYLSISLSLSPGAPIISDCLSTSLIHLSFWGTSCRQRARLRGRGWELGGGGEVKLILDYRWRRTNRGPRATRLRMGTSTLHRQ